MHDDRGSMIGRPVDGFPRRAGAWSATRDHPRRPWPARPWPSSAMHTGTRSARVHPAAREIAMTRHSDLTQSYFAGIAGEARDRGPPTRNKRAISLLLEKTDCQHFIIDQYPARKHHGPPPASVAINGDLAESRYRIKACRRYDPGTSNSTGSWAVTLLDRGLSLLAQEYEAKGRAAVFDCLKCVLVQSEAGVPVTILAAQLGKTEGAVYTDVHRLKRRYREVLLREVAATLDDQSSAEDEIRSLFAAFRT